MDGRRVKRLRALDLVLQQAHESKWTITTPGLEDRIARLLSPLLLSPDAQKQYVDSLVNLLRLEAQNRKRVRIDFASGGYELVDEPTTETLPRLDQSVSTKTPA